MESPQLDLVVENPPENKSDENLFAENSKEKIALSNPESPVVENSSEKQQHGSSRNRYKEIRETLLPKWKKIFVASCLLAVLVDPLFLYIPMIKDDIKCLLLDTNLSITALVLRSITDIFYLIDIVYQIHLPNNYARLRDGSRSRDPSKVVTFLRNNCARLRDGSHSRDPSKVVTFLRNYFVPTANTIWRSYSIQINLLAIVPIPQVAILVLFPRLRGSTSLNPKRVILNLLVLLQFVPRVVRIYLSCKQLRDVRSAKDREETATWVKGVLNFFMYILASHVLGAIWYFFAIQRMTICWQSACRKENECGTFSCSDDHPTFRNVTFLNDLCPPNSTLFDFGLYTSVLQSGIAGSSNFLQKFSNCFWWGLRHLSSLGSNLEPSIDEWENFFASFISIIGLLLFLYLIGNLQTYMQLDTARIETYRHKLKIEAKMEEKGEEIDRWLLSNGIPERSRKDIKPHIMKKVQPELEEKRDVDVENILTFLSSKLETNVWTKLESDIKRFMPLTQLQKVEALRFLDNEVLKQICGYFEPTKYAKDVVIIQEDKPLEMMLLVVDGVVSIETTNNATSSSGNYLRLGAGNLCGESLVTTPPTSFPLELPKASASVRAISDVVEALVVMASDISWLGSDELFIRCHLASATRTFTEKEIKVATNNYSEKLHGGGYFGINYKGKLGDNTEVVVKKLDVRPKRRSYRSDALEIIKLAQIKHRNVVRLLGCLALEEDDDDRPIFLVYEFINNATNLEDLIRKREKRLPLKLRLKIAAETAEALAYLHCCCPRKILHQHVNTSNILVDENHTPKLDVGILQFHGLSFYEDLEQDRNSEMTGKSDVNAFGVVLAKLLTVYEPTVSVREDLRALLAIVERGGYIEIVGYEIFEFGQEETKKVVDLALRCLALKSSSRPSMTEVASEIRGLLDSGRNRSLSVC